ncbi:MAG: hypothetical protein GY850_28785, partial [bacterium]|nr:hypothetical protein [bacterium]
MKKTTILFTYLVTLFLITPSLWAETWMKTYGGSGSEIIAAVRQISPDDIDSDYIAVGTTDSFGAGKKDILVVKLDKGGEIKWQKAYGGTGNDEARDIQTTDDNGFIIVGSTDSFGAGGTDIWVVKLASDGSLEWQKTYGGSRNETGYSIQQTTTGYIIAGVTESFGNGNKDAWLLRIDRDGEFSLGKTFGTIKHDTAQFISKITTDGSYIIAGSSPENKNSNIWVMKINKDLDSQWQKGFIYEDKKIENRPDISTTPSVTQTNDGGYIVSGCIPNNYVAIKLDQSVNNNKEWAYMYGSDSIAYAGNILENQNGEYIFTGSSYQDGKFNVRTMGITADGKEIKTLETYGGNGNDFARSIIQTSDKGYMIAVKSESYSSGKDDFRLIKLGGDLELAACDLSIADNAIVDYFCGFDSASNCDDSDKIIVETINRTPLATSCTAIDSAAEVSEITVSVQDICELVDSDGDQINDDVDNCPDVYNPNQENCDADDNCTMDGDVKDEEPPVGDVCDVDYDNDKILDDDDNCPDHANNDQKDDDGDGAGYACDNCPGKSNPDQVNNDQDELGDACDDCPDDSADDNSTAAVDNCLFVWNPTQTDSDNDSVGNACDNCPDLANASQLDTDKDGWGDV